VVAGTLAFALGTILCLQWRVLPDPVFIGFLPLLLVLARDPRWRVQGLFMAGLLWAQLMGMVAINTRLPAHLEGRDLVVTGTINGVPVRQGERQRFLLALAQASPEWRHFAPRRCLLKLTWYRHAQALRAGTRWQFQVRLRRPHGSHNRYGPDTELTALRRGICATGYIRSGLQPLRLPDPWFASALGLRQHLTRVIHAWLSGFASRGIIVALVTGVRDGISTEQREILQATGTAHLVAISGLHIGLLAGFGFMLGRNLQRLLPGLYPRLAPGRLEAGMAIGLACVYAALAGFSLPTQRALIMLLVLLLAQSLGRRTAPGHALCCALILVLVHDPLAATNAGLWLSFCAVAGLLYGLAERRCVHFQKRGRWLRGLGRIQLLAWVTLLPVSLYWFGGISVSSPLANLIAVPVTGLLVVPLALSGVLLYLLGLPAAARVLLEMSATGMDQLLLALSAIRDLLPLLQLATPSPATLMIAGLGAVCLLLLPRTLRLRWLGLVWLLPVLLPASEGPPPNALWLTMFDVGQGLAILIRTHRHSLIYDTGAGFEGGWDAGSRILAPNLQRQGVRRLDRLLLSHRHLDHIGGAGGLARSITIAQLQSNVASRFLPDEIRQLPRRPCEAGRRWQWDGYRFRILSPAPGTVGRLSVNNASCVLQVTGPGGEVLLSGDIERQTEYALSKAWRQELKSAILLAPHHGSRTSSSTVFLDTVKPRWILISRGYRNRFGFPHPQVLKRYRSRAAGLLDSACLGTVRLRLGPRPGAIRVHTWRRHGFRFWHTLAGTRCVWNAPRGFVTVGG